MSIVPITSRFSRHATPCLLWMVAAAAAMAQTTTTGAFEGRVLARDGSPLAGATVIMSSTQIVRTTRCGGDGRFSLNLLNPGPWKIVITREGFQTLGQPVTVAANDTRHATFRMVPIASATVTVVDAVNAIDTSTAQVGSNLVMEDFQAIPVTRDANDLMAMAPGVADGGFSVGPYAGTFRTNNPSVGGGSAAENQYILDGLVTTDFRFGVQSAVLPTDFIDQVEVQTGGFKPEYSALGGVFNALLKSGTNTFTGSAWATLDPANGFARPKQNQFFTAAQNLERYDLGFQVGGPIVRDRLFYFVGLDSITQSGRPTPNNTGQVSDAQRSDEDNLVVKINGYLTPEQQLTFTYRGDPQTINYGNAYNAWGSGQEGGAQKNDTQSFSLSYDFIVTPSLLLSVKLGQNSITTHFVPVDATDPAVIDYLQNGGAGTTYGGDGVYTSLNDTVSKQFRLDLSWLAEHHAVKVGFSFLQSRFSETDISTGGYMLGVLAPDILLEQFYGNNGSNVLAKYRGYYAQDTWTLGRGVKVAYGFRFDEQEQYGQNDTLIMKFSRLGDYLQPRLSLIWDLHEDGKSKVSANYGVYFETIPQRLALDSFANRYYVQYLFFSPGFTYDPTNPNHYGTLAGGLYTGIQAGGGAGPTAGVVYNYGPSFLNDPVENGIKLPKRIEFTLGYDQQLNRAVTLGIHGKYRKLTDIMEDSVLTDAQGNIVDGSSGGYAPHAIIWNPGPGPVSYSTNASGDLNPHPVHLPSTLFPSVYNQFKSVDLTFAWQGGHGSLNANYTWSRLYGDYEGLVSSSTGQPAANLTSAFDYWSYYGTGLLPLDRTHTFKAYGSTRFRIPGGTWNLGFNYLIQSGVPISLWDDGSTTHGKTPGYDTIYNTNHPGAPGAGIVAASPADFNNPAYWSGQPVGSMPPNGGTYYTGPGYASLDVGGYGGSCAADFQQGNFGRTPTTSRLDLHTDLDRSITARIHLIPALDVFNAFNKRQEISVSNSGIAGEGPNPGWNQATAYQPGRNYRLSLRLKF